MIQSHQNKQALLVGNGINQLYSKQSFSWGLLLEELKKVCQIDVDLSNFFKPFPLAFDEILHQTGGEEAFKDKIKGLKRQIRSKIECQLLFNNYHSKLVSLGYDDILTTNYDYSLENSVDSNFLSNKKKYAQNKQETLHSLKRCYQLPVVNTRIWHIHGELYNTRASSEKKGQYPEESILIGYGHYAKYLEAIQQKMKGKGGTQKIEEQSLMARMKNGNVSPFWMDIFFTHNVDIVGQGFDFSENHLWWLISYRATAMRQINPKHGVEINNTIRFFYPLVAGANKTDIDNMDLEGILNKKNQVQKTKAIADLLKAFEIVPKPITCKSYTDFYDQLTSGLLHTSH